MKNGSWGILPFLLATALLCACPLAALGATGGTSAPPPAEQRKAPPEGKAVAGANGCSSASLAVLNDIVGSVFGDPFFPNPASGGRSSTDPAGCGKPNRTRRGDPGNPTTPIGQPTSTFTIRGWFR